jgi:protein arginine N-methyltransferase 7
LKSFPDLKHSLCVFLAVKGAELTIVASHDEYSLWFDVTSSEECNAEQPANKCLLPMSRLRLGEVNNTERNTTYAKVLRGLLANRGADEGQQQWVLALGDQSLLGLMAAKLGGAGTKVLISTDNQHMQQVLAHLAAENGLSDGVKILPELEDFNPSEEEGGRLVAIVADPFYTVSVLPWHNLLFWYSAQQVLKKLPGEKSKKNPSLIKAQS